MDKEERDYLRRTSPDDLLGKEGPPDGWVRAGDLGWVPPDEPAPPAVKAAPPGLTERQVRSVALRASSVVTQACLIDFEEHRVAPLEKRIANLEAQNAQLRTQLDKAVRPFIPADESRGDKERWQ